MQVIRNAQSDQLKRIRHAVTESRFNREDDGKRNSQLMVKIVNHLKLQFLTRADHPVTFDELLEEIHETEVTDSRKKSLIEDVLPLNPRIVTTADGKYDYKPPLPQCRDKKSLLLFLKDLRKTTKGGTLKDDILDSVPCAETILRGLLKDDRIMVIPRTDKKEVIFYKKPFTAAAPLDERLQDLYRSININAMDMRTIEKYLKTNGLKPMAVVRKVQTKETKARVKRKRISSKKPRDNDHVADQLEVYMEESDDGAKVSTREKKIPRKKSSKP